MINKEEVLKKLAFCDKILAKKPNDKKPMKAKISIYREVEDYKEMLNYCDTYLKLYPQDLQVCTFKAIAFNKLGNREDATKIMEFVNSEIDKYVHDDEMTKLSTLKEIESLNNELKIDNSEIKNNENSDIQILNVNDNVQANSQYNINSIDNNQSQINNNNQNNQNDQNNSSQKESYKIDAKYHIFNESEIRDLLKLNNITITEEIEEKIKYIKRYSKKKTKESCALSAQKYYEIYDITNISEFLKYSIANYDSVIEFGNPENSIYFIRGEMYFYLGDVNSALKDYKTGTYIINKTKNILDAIYVKNIKQELRGLLLSKGIILDEVIDLDLIKGKNSSKKFGNLSKEKIQEVNKNDDLNIKEPKYFPDEQVNQVDMQEIIEIVKKFSQYEDKFKKMQFKISELEMTVKEQGEKILELQRNKSKENNENQ